MLHSLTSLSNFDYIKLNYYNQLFINTNNLTSPLIFPGDKFSYGTVVPAPEAVSGDLVYYPDGGLGVAHIGIYAGNEQIIHGGWYGN